MIRVSYLSSSVLEVFLRFRVNFGNELDVSRCHRLI